jgi:hypothetical protein
MDHVSLYEDAEFEARIHIIHDGRCLSLSNETYVHNHKLPFMSLCLQGEYVETIWRVLNHGSHYRFRRENDGQLTDCVRRPGSLAPDHQRHHFPGNVLFVDSGWWHSIGNGGCDRVVTFVVRRKSVQEKSTFVLSPTGTLVSEPRPDRPATAEERQQVKAWVSIATNSMH